MSREHWSERQEGSHEGNRAWRDQAIEQARLLNPAFLGALLLGTSIGHCKEAEAQVGLPYALAYVALPIVLHKATRDALPKTISTSMIAWISVNSFAHIGFADRAVALQPLIRDAATVAGRDGLIGLHQGRVSPIAPIKTLQAYGATSKSAEVKDCINKSYFLGRWFALAGDYTTVMALWGVRP